MFSSSKSNHKHGIGKLIMLLLASALMARTVLLGILAPFPLSVVTLLYGRLIGLSAGLVLTAGQVGLTLYSNKTVRPIELPLLYIQVVMFVSIWLISILTSETIQRKLNPVKAVVIGGVILAFLNLGGMLGSFKLAKLGIPDFIKGLASEVLKTSQQVMKASKEDNFEQLALLSNPEKLIEMFESEVPGYLFALVIFSVWANMSMGLKGHRLSSGEAVTKYNENELVNFPVSDYLVWGIVIALSLLLGGDYLHRAELIPWGSFLLYAVGIFYFFKGFGVFMKLLDFLKFYGPIRTFTLVLTITLMGKYIAAVGLINMWFDFDQKLFKKNLE